MAGLPGPVRDRTYRELCEYLNAALPPDAWSQSKTVRCGIHPFAATHSVAVLQCGPAHDEIAAALQDFRRNHAQSVANLN
jgi:hypothetical protein